MDFLLGEAELVCDVDRLQQVQILFNIVNRRVVSITNDLIDSPHIDSENINRDWRYRLGMIKALKWVLSRPEEAQAHLNHLEK